MGFFSTKLIKITTILSSSSIHLNVGFRAKGMIRSVFSPWQVLLYSDESLKFARFNQNLRSNFRARKWPLHL